ncbi:MAG: 4-hydroxythreonine-4-phosphate dehydrogenase [Candidatus Tokpelaia sp. JSC188]|nr:MAG: 4-hydroxythreonine-4-phosphate dehydrogenase [Candidatus Tokpelaia sp. JSC188]
MSLPKIVISMGDPSGVGPEIIMKTLSDPIVYKFCLPIVVGDAKRLTLAGRIVSSSLGIHVIHDIKSIEYDFKNVQCIDLDLIPEDHPFGVISPISGEAAYRYIEKATDIVMKREADAICTAPLNKAALHAASHKYPGHTELLAHLTHTSEVSMMLVTGKLRVIHVTTHIGLLDAINRIEPKLVERVISRGYDVLIKTGIKKPKIGVCAINPHAGENGLFGYGEEENKIIPAIKLCSARGWNVCGPFPADTLFFLAGRGDYDMVVAMYHDQGHGPVKVLGIEAGVNITLGLPIIRTSVDHGTAFDIAGQGTVNERSLITALRQATDLVAQNSV